MVTNIKFLTWIIIYKIKVFSKIFNKIIGCINNNISNNNLKADYEALRKENDKLKIKIEKLEE